MQLKHVELANLSVSTADMQSVKKVPDIAYARLCVRARCWCS